MTTIAYRNGVLVADTVMTKGSALIGQVVKIRRNDKGHLAGASGSASYNGEFLKWFESGEMGEPPEPIEKDDAMDRGLIFRNNGQVELYEPGGMFKVKIDYFAVGSGCDFAIGAMHAGASAEEAVRASCEHDPNTREPITVLRADTP